MDAPTPDPEPAVFSYAFHSFTSENIARYNESLVPLLWSALIVVAFRAFAGEASRLAAEKPPPPAPEPLPR